MPAPLAGFRVVDLSQGLAGPYCAAQLSDAGAEVVKVEPLEGDRSRGWPPLRGGEGAVFHELNRGKRGLALDLAVEAGRAVLRDLLRGADALVLDLLPDDRAAAGLDYATLERLNPSLVVCSITPWGSQGPLANQPGAELPAQAMADYTNSLGRAGEPPVRLGANVASLGAGQAACQGVLAALFERLTSGRGQEVEVSLFGTLVQMRGIIWTCQSDSVDDWYGFHQETYTKPPDYGYRCKDGSVYVVLGRFREVTGQGGPAGLLEELGIGFAADDPRFDPLFQVTGTGRYAAEVKDIWEQAFRDRTVQEVCDFIRRWGGTAVPMNELGAIVAHPQVEVLGMVQEVADPTLGSLRVAGVPWKLQASPAAVQGPPPTLGQHTDAILAELGYGPEQVANLRQAGLIA